MNAQRHMAEVAQLPCIVCVKTGNGNTPAQVHHILRGGKRLGHYYTIPLFEPHHKSGLNTPELVSRHPWKREFERRYGTELELFELTNEQLSIVRGGA